MSISEGMPDTSGIYKITCTANKRIYIGSAMNLRTRKNNHWHTLRQNKHKNPSLQNAWNKYGEPCFIFEILELVLPMSLTAREQYWFNRLQPFGRRGYNIASEAGSQLGYSPTPEAREKMRQTRLGKKHSPETLEKLKGRKHTPESREKIRQARLGKKLSPEHAEANRKRMLGRKHSLETREKIRQGNLGKKMSPESIEKRQQSRWGKKEEQA